MDLRDLLSATEWQQLEREVFDRFNITPVTANGQGGKIGKNEAWCNPLCPEARKNSKFITQVCAVASQNMTTVARRTKKPLVEECDIGLVKVVVPVFFKETFLGTVGGCGLLLPDGEVDAFYVGRSADMPEEQVEALAEDIPILSKEKTRALVDFIQQRLDEAFRKKDF